MVKYFWTEKLWYELIIFESVKDKLLVRIMKEVATTLSSKIYKIEKFDNFAWNCDCIIVLYEEWNFRTFIWNIRNNKILNWVFIWVLVHDWNEEIVREIMKLWVDDLIITPLTQWRLKTFFRRVKRFKEKWLIEDLKDKDPKVASLIRTSSSILFDVLDIAKTKWQIDFDTLRANTLTMFETSMNIQAMSVIEQIKWNWKLFKNSLKFAWLMNYVCKVLEYNDEQLKDIFVWSILYNIWYSNMDLEEIENVLTDENKMCYINQQCISFWKLVMNAQPTIPDISKNIVIYHKEFIDWSWVQKLKWTEIPQIWKIASILSFYCSKKWPLFWKPSITSSNIILNEMENSWKFDNSILIKIRPLLDI